VYLKFFKAFFTAS